MTRSGDRLRGIERPISPVSRRDPGPTRTRRSRPPRPPGSPRDPYGLGPAADWIAPALAVVGLLVVASFTFGLLTGDIRLPGTRSPGSQPGNGGGGSVRTPAPSNVVVVPTDPRAEVPGSIAYVKGGNVWVQSGTRARQVTQSGSASQPSWSPDGEWLYYVETAEEDGRFPARGRVRRYVMELPSLMRIRADASGEAETLATGRITPGQYSWFYWIRQPTVSPDGRTLAVISDGPDPTQSNMVLQLFDLETREFSRPTVPEHEPLGHQDPAWRPDGEALLVVQNALDGSRGNPSILSWDPATDKAAVVAGPGYLAPSWSRDQRWIAAARTTSLGTDVAILDAATGAEVFRVTDDRRSWSPVWSPLGDEIAFLHEDGGIVDLRLARLDGTAPDWRVTETFNLTEVSGLDALSRPGWFIPPDDLPPLPTDEPSAGPSAELPPATGSEATPAP